MACVHVYIFVVIPSLTLPIQVVNNKSANSKQSLDLPTFIFPLQASEHWKSDSTKKIAVLDMRAVEWIAEIRQTTETGTTRSVCVSPMLCICVHMNTCVCLCLRISPSFLSLFGPTGKDNSDRLFI